MSRLTRPFYKQSYDFPRPVHPLSPPETDITAESIPVNINNRELSFTEFTNSTYTKVDPLEAHGTHMPPDTNGRYRKSNLSYVHSGSFRNESRSAPRSATRWLIMVLPPPTIFREHNHGLYLNASARTGQAILMPLFTSLPSQLSAIAREFAFPSTSGISIYLQMGDAGMQFTPRISEESWPILWGNTLDEKQGSPAFSGLPIAGRIEFDLDLKKARWFDMWVTACRKEIDISPPGPSSVARHGREASSSTYEPVESVADDVSVTIQQKVPIIRHIPRKLSLLDRVDVSSLKHQITLSPTEEAAVPSSPLAPVPQLSDEEVETKLQRVEKKVKNWRASSSFAKSPLVATTGQTALDPANMPNNLSLSDVATEASPQGLHPLNLDDFQWSISSAGPSSHNFDIDACSDGSRIMSVHLDQRLEGSVCLTPTTCTSFGPPDYEVVSPISHTYRLPSPDVAARCLYSPPLSPVTATSWGAPSEYPDSPAYSYRAPSVDIAARQVYSRPVTPTTATSWGAPLEWPASPAYSSRAPSVDIAARQLWSRPATPSTATSWGAPLEWPDSPLMHSPVPTPGLEGMFFDEDDEPLNRRNVSTVWKHVWPYVERDVRESAAQPWKQVWPYNAYIGKSSRSQVNHHDSSEDSTDLSRAGYPTIVLYPPVYPYFDLYPQRNTADGLQMMVSIELESKYPIISIYKVSYPTFEIYPGHVVAPQKTMDKSVIVKLPALYPAMEIYAPVYPHLVIYPPTVSQAPKKAQPWKQVWPYNAHIRKSLQIQTISRDSGKKSADLTRTGYPTIILYPPVYPYFDLYPQRNTADVLQRMVSIELESKYPVINIYKVSYPTFEIYPGHVVAPQETMDKTVLVKLPALYPTFEIYAPVYPHLAIYPPTVPRAPKVDSVTSGYPNLVIYPPVSVQRYRRSVKSVIKNKDASKLQQDVIVVALRSCYPVLDIYPAVYPYNLYSTYPPQSLSHNDAQYLLEAEMKTKYPCFDIYPAVYPFFDLYPAVARDDKLGAQKSSTTLRPVKASSPASSSLVPIACKVTYPRFDIYPAVYPFFDIYRSGSANAIEQEEEQTTVLKAVYPQFNLYPAVYPYFDIYNSGIPTRVEMKAVSVELQTVYPYFDIYPAVYPYFDLYRTGSASTPETNVESTVTLTPVYPFFDIYPAVYPFFDIYCSGVATTPQTKDKPSVLVTAAYPFFDIYPSVYPHIQLYPALQGCQPATEQTTAITATSRQGRKARKTHKDLCELVFSERLASLKKARRPRKTHKQLCEIVFAELTVNFALPVPSHIERKASDFRSVSDLAPVPEGSVSPDDAGSPEDRLAMRARRPRVDVGFAQTKQEPIRRSTSLRQSSTTSSQSGVSLPRSNSLRGPRPLPATLDRDSVSPTKTKSRRDSIVLEKARLWGAQANHKSSSSIDDALMSEFPMPPAIPLSHAPPPSLSSPVSSLPQRRVSKLDRSKYPFH